MDVTDGLTYALFVLGVVVVACLVVGQALGQPVLLSYVTSSSMSPTLSRGDGFVAVPIQLGGSVERGDVVVFEAEEVQGGGLTTHRVVGETERGYITKGDANTFTDQDDGEPPVKRTQVLAKALQVDGTVVGIPFLGSVVEGVQSVLETVQRHLSGLLGTSLFLGVRGLAYLFFAVTVLWYIVGEWRGRDTRPRRRDTERTGGTDVRLLVGAFTAVLVLGGTAAMVGPAGTEEYSIVSAEFDSDRATVIQTGGSEDVTYRVGNSGVVPVFVYLEPGSEGVEVQPRRTSVPSYGLVDATVTLHAPPETGYYRRFVVEHRYLAVLPRPVVSTLYRFHPWAPVVVIDVLVGVPFYLFGVALLGNGRIRDRSRSRGLPALTRLRRALRGLY